MLLTTRLPWIGPILPPTLHLPVTYVWAVALGHEAPVAVLGWQCVAWPLLAMVCLVTMSPLLRLTRGMRLATVVDRRILFSGGLCASVVASLLYLPGPRIGVSIVLAWGFALLAAFAFERWRMPNPPGEVGSRRRRKAC